VKHKTICSLLGIVQGSISEVSLKKKGRGTMSDESVKRQIEQLRRDKDELPAAIQRERVYAAIRSTFVPTTFIEIESRSGVYRFGRLKQCLMELVESGEIVSEKIMDGDFSIPAFRRTEQR